MYPKDCPNCKHTLVGARIPDNLQEDYGATHYSMAALLHHKSGAKHWECPFCWHTWAAPKLKPFLEARF